MSEAKDRDTVETVTMQHINADEPVAETKVMPQAESDDAARTEVMPQTSRMMDAAQTQVMSQSVSQEDATRPVTRRQHRPAGRKPRSLPGSIQRRWRRGPSGAAATPQG